MKKLIILNNIVNREEFISEVVNKMPVVFGAKFENVDMEDYILVEDKFVYDAIDWLKKDHVRCVIG